MQCIVQEVSNMILDELSIISVALTVHALSTHGSHHKCGKIYQMEVYTSKILHCKQRDIIDQYLN